MIEILEVKTVGDAANNIPATRHADIIISSGPTAYLWSVGGLPVSGNLQTILDAREAELFAAAQTGGRAVPAATQAQSGARTWLKANPNASLLFELSIDDLTAEIDSLDLTALPAATRNKLKLLLKTLAVAVRVLAKREGLS